VFVAILAAGAAATPAFAQTEARIQPRVLELAKTGQVIPVFIVLAHQPQRELLERAESANAVYHQVAESRYRQAAERPAPNAEELRQAREEAEAVLLRTRAQAFQTVEQAVGPEQDALEAHLKGLGAARISRYLGINMMTAEIPGSAIADLEANPDVARVFLVEKQRALLATSVPLLGAPAFWTAGFTGQGESVAILDTGVKTNHPAFAGESIVSQVFLTYGSQDSCFIDNAGSAQDQEGHGTHVAGIVASLGSAGWTNYQGVAKGIGTLYNLKVGYLVSSTCLGGALSDPRDVAAALDWAVRNTPLKVLNYSYGAPVPVFTDDDGFSQIIDSYIDSYGLAITIAAGNDGQYHSISSPGIAHNGITVGNWISRGVMNPTSSFGATYGGRPKPDLAAPGTNIFSTAYDWDAKSGTGNDFVSHTGTSMAAPHIAGSVALLESAGVSNTLAAKAILINSTDNPRWAYDSGWGYTNLNNALAQLHNVETGTLAGGETRLYRVAVSGDFRASVVWNRHVTGSTSNSNQLNLELTSADTGAYLDLSPMDSENAKQVSTTYTGTVIVALTMQDAPLSGVTSEPFAIAFSGPFTPFQQQLDLTCLLPAWIPSGAQFTLNCGVKNNGDLTALSVEADVVLPPDFTGNTGMAFGDLAPGGFRTSNIDIQVPPVSGTYALRVKLHSSTGPAGTKTFSAVLQPPAQPPALVSPANGAAAVPLMPTLTWNPVPGALSYNVSVSTLTPLGYTQNFQTGTTANIGPLDPETVYYWQITAHTINGSIASDIWSFTTQSSSGQPPYILTKVAGCNYEGCSGDGGPATSAGLEQVSGLAADAAGNIFIAGGEKVRKVTPDGIIHTVAGNANEGFSGDGGPATSADMFAVRTVAYDAAGDLFIADGANFRIRKVTPDGVIHTIAGAGCSGETGDGGPATSACLSMPWGVAVDASGNLYISNTEDDRIRKVAPNGIITTFAGTGYTGSWSDGFSGDGGPAVNAQFASPHGLAVDAAGNVFIADTGNNRIRKVRPDGIIVTVAGNGDSSDSGDGGQATSAGVASPMAVAVDNLGGFYIAGGTILRYVAPNGVITSLADGYPPESVAVSPSGQIYFGISFDVYTLAPVNSSRQYSLSQSTFAMPNTGGIIPISIQTGPACPWTASGLSTWLGTKTVGQGPATVNLSVAPNYGLLRSATFSLAGIAVTVMQAETSCTASLNPNLAAPLPAGGTGSIAVTAGPSCPWVVSGAPGWMTITGPNSGVGDGSVSYSVSPNPGDARSATLTIAGLPFNIQQDGLASTALRFVPVPPCRVVDTRFTGPTMAAAETRSFPVPQSTCGIPATAQAYSLNVTVVPQGPLSYLTLWPASQDQPFVSTLNSLNGTVVANAAIVPAGSDGAVNVYVTNPTDVILDINGYFDSARGTNAYSFYPATPCRIADTRNPAGAFGGPSMAADESRDFGIPVSACGLPAAAKAYSLNVTVVPDPGKRYLGYLSAWPAGQAQPLVSTLNSWTGKVVANAAMVPAGTNGAVSVFVTDLTDVILDANGYFAAPGSAGALSFYPVTPCRVADTRNADGPFGGPIMAPATPRSFPVPSSACGIPTTAAAYSMNVTVVPDGGLGYLTVWPTGSAQPLVSTLNSFDGSVVANAAIVPAGTNGAISVFTAGSTHVVLDINGYFAP
jgi:subtilisin family serine protease